MMVTLTASLLLTAYGSNDCDKLRNGCNDSEW